MTATQKEELRRLCLRWLAERCALAFHGGSVQAGVRREMPCTLDEIEEALLFLASCKLLDPVPNSLGATRYYQANAAGILAYERGE